MDLRTTKEAVEIIYLSQRRIAELCDEGEEFPGAFKKGDMWLIPLQELLIYRMKHPRKSNRSIKANQDAQDAELLEQARAEAALSKMQSDEGGGV